MNLVECVQGTEEWKAARAGNVTASRVADVMSKIKTGEAAGRRNYRIQIVAELLTGLPQDGGFVSQDMKNGTEQEPFARAAYEVSRDVMVEQIGFVLHPSIERFGASPDGILADGMLEIKCPKATTHIEYLLGGVAPSEYHLQMLAGMDCCERSWCDFVSYCPLLPENLQMFVVRFQRDDKRIAEMRDAIIQFNKEVDQTVANLPKEKVNG